MNRRSNAWLPLGILVVLVATSAWLQEVVDGSAGGPHLHRQASADLIVAGFSLHQLDATGKPRYTLSAQRMEHYPDESAAFEQMQLTAFEPGEAPLHLSARHARRQGREDQVVLWDAVQGERAAGPGTPPLLLTTARLEVQPERRQGVAPGPVLLMQGQDRLEADTMSFDLKLSTVRFTRAKASFQPNRPAS